MKRLALPVVVLMVVAMGLSFAASVATAEEPTEVVRIVRADGTSRPQAIRIAYRRADELAQEYGPYEVLRERVYPEGPRFWCILTIRIVF